MNVPEAFPVFRFHFLKLDFLFWSQEGGNLRVGFGEAGEDALHRLAVDGFHVGAGFFDEGFDLCPLLIGQLQDRLEMREHVLRHFVRRGRSHEGTPKNRREQRPGNESGKKDQGRVKDDSPGAHVIHSRSSR